MIITGYQGIGKSTLAKKRTDIIDLESSCFWKTENGERTKPSDWYVYYCQMAEHLSKQGYIVFVSCHQEVREWLAANGTEKFYAIFPDKSIKEDGLNRLYARYQASLSYKDLAAYARAENCYDKDIDELTLECSPEVEWYSEAVRINNIRYDLEAIIAQLEN